MAVAESLGEISERLEAAVFDASRDPSERIRDLKVLMDDIKMRVKGEPAGTDAARQLQHLGGRCQSYIGSLELQRESENMRRVFERALAREDAEIRDRLAAEGVEEAELDAAGLVSHRELEEAAEDGTLEEGIKGKAFGLAANFREFLVRRSSGGQFRDKPGVADLKPKGRGGKALPPMPKPKMPRQQAPQPPPAPLTPEPEVPPLPKPKPPEPKPKKSPVRKEPPEVTGKEVKPSRPDLSLKSVRDKILASGLNDWPDKGEVATRILGDAADTREKHTVPVPASPGASGGPAGRAYTAERRVEHDRWVGEDLAVPVGQLLGEDHEVTRKLADGGRLDDEEKNAVRGAAAAARGGQPPKALFMAGGPASGKTSALKAAPEFDPGMSVEINPDNFKEKTDEFKEMVAAGDRYAAMGTHEESSDLGKRLQVEAMDLGLNVVVDGTGDSSPGKFARKMGDMDEAGYEIDALYVTIPTDDAVVRATLRAQKSGRWVPEPELRKQHKNVSANFNDVVALPFVRNLKVYDNTEEGQSPELIGEGHDGNFAELDADAVGRFRAKAEEPDWEAPQESGEGHLSAVDDAFVEQLMADNPRGENEEVFVWQSRICDALPSDIKHEVIFRIRERYEAVDVVADGAARWREMKGLPEPQVNIREVPASIEKAEVVAAAFEGVDDMADDPQVVAAFDDFKRQNDEMFNFITTPEAEGGLGITVEMGDPTKEAYISAEAQAEDVRENRHFTVQSGLGGEHSLMSTEEYDRFRGVHDIFGHVGVGGGFDRHGEFEAWLAHMSMYDGPGRDAMSSEYHGVNSSMWAGSNVGTGKSAIMDAALIRSPWDDNGNLRADYGRSEPDEPQSPGGEGPWDGPEHDYDPSWDYEVAEDQYEHPLVKEANEIAKSLHPDAEVHPVRGLADDGVVAKYIDGTYGAPVMVVDVDAHWESADPMGEIQRSVRHELAHARQESRGDEDRDEDDAESFGRSDEDLKPKSPGATLADPIADMTKVEPDDYNMQFQKALADPDTGSFLSPYGPDDFAKMTTFLAANGKVGGALKPTEDGHLEAVALFNHGGPRGSGRAMLRKLVEAGADRLDAIGDDLRALYESVGFEVTEEIEWDDQYAPEGWDYSSRGRPPIYLMQVSS